MRSSHYYLSIVILMIILFADAAQVFANKVENINELIGVKVERKGELVSVSIEVSNPAALYARRIFINNNQMTIMIPADRVKKMAKKSNYAQDIVKNVSIKQKDNKKVMIAVLFNSSIEHLTNNIRAEYIDNSLICSLPVLSNTDNEKTIIVHNDSSVSTQTTEFVNKKIAKNNNMLKENVNNAGRPELSGFLNDLEGETLVNKLKTPKKDGILKEEIFNRVFNEDQLTKADKETQLKNNKNSSSELGSAIPEMPYGRMISSMAVMLLIAGIFLLLAKFIKKKQIGNAPLNDLNIINSTNIGGKNKLFIVQAIDELLLLGTNDKGVSLLANLGKAAEINQKETIIDDSKKVESEKVNAESVLNKLFSNDLMKKIKSKAEKKSLKSKEVKPGDGASAPVFPSEFESILEDSLNAATENIDIKINQSEINEMNTVAEKKIGNNKVKSSAWAINNYHTSNKNKQTSGGHMNEMLKSAGKIEDTLRLLKNM